MQEFHYQYFGDFGHRLFVRFGGFGIIQECFGELSGLTLTYLGDGNNALVCYWVVPLVRMNVRLRHTRV